MSKSVQAGVPISKLREGWSSLNRPGWVKLVNTLVSLGMALLIPFDVLLFDDFETYSIPRLLQIGICITAIALLKVLQNPKIRESFLITATIIPLGILNYLYLYYLLSSSGEELYIVFTGLLLVIFFSNFVIHRFNVEHSSLNLITLVGFSLLLVLNEPTRNLMALAIICQIISWLICATLRNEFFKEMYQRYLTLKSVMPRREAFSLAVSQTSNEFEKTFLPKMRPSVCLCADWRHYQRLTKRLKPEMLSNSFEVFYGTILDQLEKVSPEGEYYVNWVADELFVIFFSDNDDTTNLRKTACEFSKQLAGPIFQELKTRMEVPIDFDIGVSFGVGYLGLQGPPGLKKTTITGEHAGIAKRLQEEAKRFRYKSTSEGELTFPTVLFDSGLSSFAIQEKIFFDEELTRVEVNHPDLGRQFWAHRYQFQTQSKV